MESGKTVTYFEQKGVIDAAELQMQRDGVFLSFYIGIDFDGTYQAMTGIVLGRSWTERKDPHVKDLEKRIFNIFNVDSWKELSGKKAYAIRKSRKLNENIIGIKTEEGHYFFIDQWRKANFPKDYKNTNVPVPNERTVANKPRNRMDEIE